MSNLCRGMMVLVLLALFPVGLFAAEGSDLASETKIGLGYEGMFLGDFVQGVSVRGWLGRLGLEANLMEAGVSVEDVDSEVWMLGGKIVFAPIVREHSKFYLGVEGGWGTMDIDLYGFEGVDVWMIGPLFGAEYRFQELPELGFNFEVGYRFSQLSADEFDDDIDLRGIFITLGLHYYFN